MALHWLRPKRPGCIYATAISAGIFLSHSEASISPLSQILKYFFTGEPFHHHGGSGEDDDRYRQTGQIHKLFERYPLAYVPLKERRYHV